MTRSTFLNLGRYVRWVVREEHGDCLKGFVGNVWDVGSDEYVDSSAPMQYIALQQMGNVVNVVSTSPSTNP